MRLRLAFAFLLTLFGIGGLSFAAGSGSFAVAGSTPPKAPSAAVKRFNDRVDQVNDTAYVRRGKGNAIEVRGWISETHFDDDGKSSTKTPEGYLVLNTKGGKTYKLEVPASADVTSTVASNAPKPAELASRDVVTVDGAVSGNTITVASAAVTETLPDPRLGPSQTQRPVENRRLLNILVSFPEQRVGGFTEPFTRQAGLTEAFGSDVGDRSVRNFFSAASLNRFVLNGDNTTWLPISTSMGTTCDYGGWMNTAIAAVRAARAADPSVPFSDPDTYDYLNLIMPDTSICTFGGVSFAARKTLSFAYGAFPTGTTIHELGHGVGLNHAGQEVCKQDDTLVPVATGCEGSRTNDTDPASQAIEYGDLDDTMGRSGFRKLFSSAHRAHLGFLPLANVATTPADGIERTITRSTEALGSSTQLVQVTRPTEATLHPNRRPLVYALELRGASNPFDTFRPTEAAVTRVAVRLTGNVSDPLTDRISHTNWVQPQPGKTVDGAKRTPGIPYDYNAGLHAGQSLYDPIENYTITVGTITATAATVKVTPGGPPGGSAAATTVGIGSGVLTAAAMPNRVNALSVTLNRDRYVVSDFGNPVTPGAGCFAKSPISVECNRTGVKAVSVSTGDRDDVIAIQNTVTVPTTLNGGDGDDNIEGSANADDAFIAASTLDGADLMLGYGGVDIVNYSARTAPISVTGSDFNTAIGANAGAEGDRIKDIENVTTGSGNDTITLTDAVARRIDARTGTDTVTAGSGDDLILVRDAAADTVNCGDGNSDRVSYDQALDSPNTTACERAFENIQVTIGPDPQEGTTIGTRTPTIALLTSGRRTGSTVQCSLTAPSGTPTWATCPVSNSWTPASPLADGSHRLWVRMLDPSNVQVGDVQQRNFTVAAIAPDTTFSSTPTASARPANVTFTAAGTGTAGWYECSLDNAAWMSCSATTKLEGLSDGSHTYRVRSVNAGGLADATPATFTWTVDGIAPDTTLSGTPAEGSTVVLGPKNLTYTSTESGSRFECAVYDWGFVPCTSPDTTAPPMAGPFTLRVRAVDVAGNPDPTPATRSFTVTPQAFDTEMLSASDLYERRYSPSKPPVYTFQATGTTGPFTFRCRIKDQAWAPCTSPWSPTVSDSYYTTIEIATVNAQGVPDYTPVTDGFVGDVDAPQTAFTSGPANGSVIATDTTTAVATFGFEAPGERPADSCENGIPDCTTFECKLDAAPWAPCPSPYTTAALSIGSHTLNVRAVDQAGNADASPDVRTWNVVAAPQTAITGGPADGSTVTTLSPSYTFTATPATGATFECRYGADVNAGSWAACVSPFTLPSTVNGQNVVQVRAKNASGYTDPTPAKRTVTINVGVLQVTPAAQPSTSVSLSAEAGYGTALDWIHPASSSPTAFDRMNATQRISTWAPVGPATTSWSNGLTTYSWTNATGTTPSGSSFFGIYRSGYTNGYSFTVPASGTETRKLRVHLGNRGAVTGELKVKLGTLPQVTQSITTTASGERSVTITYRPNTQNATLEVSYIHTGGATSSAGVRFYGASLY